MGWLCSQTDGWRRFVVVVFSLASNTPPAKTNSARQREFYFYLRRCGVCAYRVDQNPTCVLFRIAALTVPGHCSTSEESLLLSGGALIVPFEFATWARLPRILHPDWGVGCAAQECGRTFCADRFSHVHRRQASQLLSSVLCWLLLLVAVCWRAEGWASTLDWRPSVVSAACRTVEGCACMPYLPTPHSGCLC